MVPKIYRAHHWPRFNLSGKSQDHRYSDFRNWLKNWKYKLSKHRLLHINYSPGIKNWDFPSRCSLKKSENLKQSPFTRNSPSIHLILYPLQVWFSYFSKIDFANFNLLLTDFTLPIPLSYFNKNAFGLECEYLLFHFTASYWVNIVSPKLWKWTECDTCKISDKRISVRLVCLESGALILKFQFWSCQYKTYRSIGITSWIVSTRSPMQWSKLN